MQDPKDPTPGKIRAFYLILLMLVMAKNSVLFAI
jgi:hypothetical protein